MCDQLPNRDDEVDIKIVDVVRQQLGELFAKYVERRLIRPDCCDCVLGGCCLLDCPWEEE